MITDDPVAEIARLRDAVQRAEARVRELQTKLDCATGLGITIDIDVLGADQRRQVFDDTLERIMVKAAMTSSAELCDGVESLVEAMKREGL